MYPQSPPKTFDIESFLDSDIDPIDPIGDTDGNPDSIHGTSWSEPGYTGQIDYRIRQLSYSSFNTLHSCPRKYQLYKLRSTHKAPENITVSITFAFGHAVGEAIQESLKGYTRDQIIWKMFLAWPIDLFDSDLKSNKGFFQAVTALDRFLSIRESSFMEDYELVYVDGVPACELSFCINFPDGFRYRGFVDAVLRTKSTGEIIVLECKTTGANSVNPATYKNSAQALGYSIVLDHLFPNISSYEVLYLIYLSKTREYQVIPFVKTYQQRALWIRELLLDIESIKMYEEAGIYPQHGESCMSFRRECEYLATCGMSTSLLTKPCTPEMEDKTEYQVDISLLELLEAQERKSLK